MIGQKGNRLIGRTSTNKAGQRRWKKWGRGVEKGIFLVLATSPLGLYKSHLNGKRNQMEEGPSSDMRHTQPMRKKILLFDVILKFNSRKCIIAITRTLQWLSSLRFLSPRMTARKSGSYLKSNQPSLKLNVCVFHRCTLSSKLKVHWEESVLKICEGLKGTLSLYIYVYLSLCHRVIHSMDSTQYVTRDWNIILLLSDHPLELQSAFLILPSDFTPNK